MKVVCLKTTTNQLQFCIALHFFLKTGVSVMCTFLNRLLLVNAGVFLSTAFACATPVQNDDYLLGLLPQKRYNFQIRQPQSRILAKTAAMKWKQIGSTHFNNTAPIDSSVQWNIFHRDTMLYDAAGNMVLKKTTLAHSGWARDSVWMYDSLMYEDGELAEGIYFFYHNLQDTIGNRNIYNYSKDRKAFVETKYNFQVPDSWVPDFKDSMAYSAPVINDGSWLKDLSNLIERYTFRYDSSSHSWINESSIIKVNAECDSVTLVLQGRGRHWPRFGGNDTFSFADLKMIMTFSSSDWSDQTLVETRQQEKDHVTGLYIDAYINRTSFVYDECYDWDSTGLNLTCWYKYYRDSHGNDTLRYQRQSTEKGYNTRLARAYDDNGNNIVTIESVSYTDNENVWEITRKDTNYFAQINVPTIRSVQAAPPPKVSIIKACGTIRFSAPGITALNLYDASGRLVTSIRQQAAPSISLNLSSYRNTPVLSGMYVAELVSKYGKNAFAVPVYR
jgi:hypothetical protein